MATASVWRGVSMTAQSALAAAKTLTAITKASPAVATSTAHGFTNGQWVVLKITGMYQLDKTLRRVANVTANTFEIEGIDSTGFDTFSSGTAEAATLGTVISTVTNVNPSGGDQQFVDTTTVHQLIKTQIPDVANAIVYTMTNVWDPADAGLLALKAYADSRVEKGFLVGWPNGKKAAMYGFVACTLIPMGSGLVTTDTAFTLSSLPAYYPN
jgi:hypothetical protein